MNILLGLQKFENNVLSICFSRKKDIKEQNGKKYIIDICLNDNLTIKKFNVRRYFNIENNNLIQTNFYDFIIDDNFLVDFLEKILTEEKVKELEKELEEIKNKNKKALEKYFNN